MEIGQLTTPRELLDYVVLQMHIQLEKVTDSHYSETMKDLAELVAIECARQAGHRALAILQPLWEEEERRAKRFRTIG